MNRFDAINTIISSLDDELVISANGLISRQLFSIKDRPQNFYMLGSMGLASSIGLGVSLSKPERRVIILDGDGNILMNLGSLTTIGYRQPKNLLHFVLDNACYESTGGQPTTAKTAMLDKIAKAAGYKTAERVSDVDSLKHFVAKIPTLDCPAFLLIEVEKDIIAPSFSRVMTETTKIKERFIGSL